MRSSPPLVQLVIRPANEHFLLGRDAKSAAQSIDEQADHAFRTRQVWRAARKRCANDHIVLPVQNKLIWAISRQTAAELVYRRVNASMPLMGMQSFDKKNTVAVKKADVSIAKNYLAEDEIKLLGLLVEQYLAFAETMAQQRTPMYMADWIQRLDVILKLNGRDLLSHAGKISSEMALEKSDKEFEKYQITQKNIEKLQNLNEIEEDIKKMGKPKK